MVTEGVGTVRVAVALATVDWAAAKVRGREEEEEEEVVVRTTRDTAERNMEKEGEGE